MSEAVFKDVSVTIGEEIVWQPLPNKGLSNRLYRGYLAGQPMILRIEAGQDLAFGCDRARERAVLSVLADFHWSPDVVAISNGDSSCGWMLMEDAGEVARVLSGHGKEQLLAALSEWQRISVSNLPEFDFKLLWLEYQRVFNQLKAPHKLSKQLEQCQSYFAQLPSLPSTLTHHDLHPGNLCWREDQLTVLDWEYAGLSNPLLDADSLHRNCAIDIADLHLLPAFQSLSYCQLLEGICVAENFNRALEQLWFSVRDLIVKRNKQAAT